MKIIVGADHGGYLLKGALVTVLQKLGHEVRDLGAFSSEATDYPDFAHQVAAAVASGAADRIVM